MRRKSFALVLAFSLVFSITYGYSPTDLILKNDNLTTNPQSNNDPTDPIGDVFLFGTTYYDIQHNGTCGRQIQIDSEGWIHAVWMKGLNISASQRHIYYQLMEPDSLFIPGGIQVDQSPRAGYCVLEVYPDNRAMPAFHQLTAGYENFHSALGFDYFPHCGAFSAQDLPWVMQGTYDLEVIWPKMDMDIEGRFHIISTENLISPGEMRLYYCRANFDPLTFSINYETPEQVEVGLTSAIAANVACSPVSNRVTIGWMEYDETGGPNRVNGDLIICTSEDGVTWDWTDTVNVTNWLPPDPSLLPDTAAANQDTFRCADDMCLLYDYNDVLHIFFTTGAYYAFNPYGIPPTWGNSFIWHWDEVEQMFSMVANGWYLNDDYDTGAWNLYVCRPSAAVDPITGDLYCAYQRFLAPADTFLIYPYLWADDEDFSAGGYPNSEIWMTRSLNNGWSWAEGTNVTDTQSPNAFPGDCLSEMCPTIAPEIENSNCHLFYTLDKDAGIYAYGNGEGTLNDMIYQRVPVSAISQVPPLYPYPMHCDSTGFTGGGPPPPPNVYLYLIPENPPIIIPPGGGSFNFDLSIANVTQTNYTIDAWTDITLPGGVTYPIFLREGINLPSSGGISREDLTQFVPASALAGYYQYNAYVRDHNTWQLLAADSFPFVKDEGDESANHDCGWALVGWDGDETPISPHPSSFILHPCSPNPFNPSTVLSFELRDASSVELIVCDILGREVARLAEGYYSPGEYDVVFDGSSLSSGIYFACLQANDLSRTQKILLIK
ncbi:MAG: T9SS type A sorting domain-containing protein [candidate division Zixibacteria bacterium]|nr:T9SS type A sorting domain-containing protein [Candidatus Tariuqbacter arcticus]